MKKMERLKQLKLNTKSKWVSAVASIWIQCTSGSLYTFAVYSTILKSTQHYDQSTLDTVSVFKDIGGNFGILSGLLYTYSTRDRHYHQPLLRQPTRFLGPWVVHLAGAIQCFAGYFLMWASVVGLIPRPPVPVMCLFMLLAAHSSTFFNTADLVTSVRNFPSYSGTAVGLMKGFLGLSGAILIQVYQTIFNDKPTAFLLMLALLSTINPLLLMWFVRIYNANQRDEKKYLNELSLITLILATYLMVIIILEHNFVLPSLARVFTLVLLLFLLASPLCIPIRAQEWDSTRISETVVCEEGQLTDDPHQVGAGKMDAGQEPSGYHHLPSNNDQETETDGQNTPQLGENLNMLQAIRTVDFWILFFAMACGMGSGLATVNNISQIGGSLGYSSYETNSLVSLWGIWNFFGRFGAGYVSDYFLHFKGWARPLFMVITLATMSIGHLVIASGLPRALYTGSILVGVGYGSQWSLMPTIASEIFGVGHLGTIFNTITIASPVGSYIFSVRVVGYIYDREASGKGDTCTGTHCFMLSFLIMASATFLGSLAALGLYLRTKRFYNQVILRRLFHSVRD